MLGKIKMACKTETKTINDREYNVTQWNAEKAIKMKFRLLKILGPAFAKLAPAFKTQSDEEQATAIGEAVELITSKMDPEEMFALIKDVISGVGCEGKKITDTRFNELYSGDDLFEVYKVFFFVLQVNFSNLLKGQFVEGVLAKAKEMSDTK